MKPNPMLAKLQARHELELRITRSVTRQEMMDCAMLALNRAFHFGPKMNIKFRTAMEEVVNEVAGMAEADTEDKEYAIAKFEEALALVCGEHYAPREVRYDG